MLNLITKDLEEAQKVLGLFLNDKKSLEAVEKSALMITAALKKGNKIISCGNGGSMCDAMHFAEELTGRYRENRISLPAIALSDPAHITCTANDFGFEYIFSRLVESLGSQGDVLVVFTSSGNSENILQAVNAAKEKGIKVIAITGKTGGKLASLCDVEIRAPKSMYADRTQEIHIKVVHIILNAVETLMGYA